MDNDQTVTEACQTCGSDYNPGIEVEKRRHTEPIPCNCGRCHNKPGCYACGSMHCTCPTH